MTSARKPLQTKERLMALSLFRYRLRSFLRFSEDAAREVGITVLQYQLLLHVCGFPGRDWATISELAERLQSHLHGVVALVSRCEELGLVKRRQSRRDRRQVEVHLLAKGRKCLEHLAFEHEAPLADLARAIEAAATTPGVTASSGGSPDSQA
jgi:DNA-binding MarR family transcriptional regulator